MTQSFRRNHLTLATLLLAACTARSAAQTNPTPLALPVSQNWGTAAFNTMPSGFAAWSGLSGGAITSQALAEASSPTGDEGLLTSTPSNGNAGGCYGFLAAPGDAQFAILESSNATHGVDQLALAINTAGSTNITLTFDYIAIVLNPRAMGVVVQYRVGASGSWTTIVGAGNPYVESSPTFTVGQVTPVSLTLPAAADNQPVVQIRWATWRATGSGNSSGTSIDNITVTGTGSGLPLVMGISLSEGPAYDLGDSPVVTVTLSSPPETSATVDVTSGAFPTATVTIVAPALSGSTDLTMTSDGTFTATATAVSGAVGSVMSPSFTVTGAPAPSFAAAGGNNIDDAAGNSNNAIDPNEGGIQLTIPIINNGTAAATGLSATLTPLTAGVSVTIGTRSYPDLDISATGVNTLPFVVSGDPGLPCGSTITFQVAVTAGEGSGTFTVNFTACPPSTADAYDPPPDYYTTATGTGATLKTSLHNIIDGDYWNGFLSSGNHKVRSYDDAKYALQLLDVDPSNSNNIILMYTGVSVPKVWNGGSTWNREHQWPDSHGINGTLPAYGDLHHLRPCNPTVNSTRGSLSFGIGPSLWDPDHGMACRGRVARSMFYMNTRYNGHNPATLNLVLVNGAVNSSTNQLGDLARLVEWHYAYPVDGFERRRNATVFSNTLNPTYYQGNRNPFIDHPEYVWSIYGTFANDSLLYVGQTPPTDGTSSANVVLDPVIVGAAPSAPQSLALNKIGSAPTTYDVQVFGQAVSDATAPRQTFVSGAQSRSFSAGLNMTTATPGLKSGTIVIDNTDLTTGGTGMGTADGNDIITVSANVLSHSNASFSSSSDTDTLTFDLGTFVSGTGVHTGNAAIYDLEATPGFTAGLSVTSVSGSGNTSQLYTDLAPPQSVAAGTNLPFAASLDTTTTGDFTATYTIAVADQSLPGATSGPSLTLTLTGHVVAPVPADFNRDRHVDNLDFDHFNQCATRESVLQTNLSCTDADLDGDGDVDPNDFGRFQLCYSGSTSFVNQACAN